MENNLNVSLISNFDHIHKKLRKLVATIDIRNTPRDTLKQILGLEIKEESDDSIFFGLIEILKIYKRDTSDSVYISNYLNSIEELKNALEIDSNYGKLLMQMANSLKYKYYVKSSIIFRQGK